VQEVYEDALKNFQNSEKHTFDGSGVPVIFGLTSTYPDPSFSAAKCKSSDQSQFPTTFLPLRTSWSFGNPLAQYSISSFCAYDAGTIGLNGIKTAKTGGVSSGSTVSFIDSTRIVPSITLRKRMYCISVNYRFTASSIPISSIECTLGLLYVSFYSYIQLLSTPCKRVRVLL
jgi:hypothetical protein